MPACPHCRLEVPGSTSRCPVCSGTLPPSTAEYKATGTPIPSAPNYTKAGFGAKNVKIQHDASQHNTTHHNGIPPVLLVSLVCIIISGFIFLALVFRPTPPPPGHSTHVPSSSALLPPAPVGRVLKVELNRLEYKVGSHMEITVTSAQSGYLYVLAVWADDRVDTLFPNSLQPDAHIEAHSQVVLPKDLPPNSKGERLVYTMDFPSLEGNPTQATESILAVLSPVPMNLPQSIELTSSPGFSAIGKLSDAEFRSRGPTPRFMKLKDQPQLDFSNLPQDAVHYKILR